MLYDIADLKIEIKNRLKYTDKFCEGYLAKDQTLKPDISVAVTDDDFKKEKAESQGFSDGYIENLCIYRKICNRAPDFDRFLLHSSVIEYDGDAYAFLGKSGAGKSTHSSLWIKHLEGARFLNGDKPILGYKDNSFYVYGTPWQGKEGYGYNGKAKLKCACFIEQAKENSITRLTADEFAERVFSQILMPENPDGVMKTLALLDNLVKTIPAYLLKCDISEDAFKTSSEVMLK